MCSRQSHPQTGHLLPRPRHACLRPPYSAWLLLINRRRATPWVQLPASTLALSLPQLSNATLPNATTTAAAITIPPIFLGLLAPCSGTAGSGVPSCAAFSSAFVPSPAAQGAAACLLLGFAAGLLGFLVSCVACLGCCLTPAMLCARLWLAGLALFFTGAGAVVGGSFVRVPLGDGSSANLAQLMQRAPSAVGAGLGLSIAAALLQLVSLALVAGTRCCQPGPAAAAPPPSSPVAVVVDRGGGERGSSKSKKGGGKGEAVSNPLLLSGKKRQEAGAAAATPKSVKRAAAK